MKNSVAALAALVGLGFAKPLPVPSGSVAVSAAPVVSSAAPIVPVSSSPSLAPVEAAVVQPSSTTETTYTTAGHTFVVVAQPSNAVLVEEQSTTVTISEGSKTTFQDRRVSIDSTGSLTILSSSAAISSAAPGSSSATVLDVQQKAVVNPASGSGVPAASSAQAASGLASVVAGSSSVPAIDVQQKAVVNSASGSGVAAASSAPAASGAASASGVSSEAPLDVQQKAVVSQPAASGSAAISGSAAASAPASAAVVLPSGSASAAPQQKAIASGSASATIPSSSGGASVSGAPAGASSGAALLVVDGDSTVTFQQKAAVQTAGGLVATQCKLITQPLSTWTYSYFTGTDVNAPLATSVITFTEQLACTCSGGVIAGVNTKVDSLGQSSIYCAIGAATPSAVATVVPTGTPGDANNEAWANVPCSYGSLTDATNDPQTQWNDAGAAAAWADAVEQWKEKGQSPADFSNHLANFFHARPSPNCGFLENSNCEVTVNCGQHDAPNAPVNSPAGYVLFNSMIGLHSVFEQAYASVNDALPNVLADVGNLVSSFSPINDEIKAQQQLKLTLDIIQGVLTFTLAPVFHSILGKMEYWSTRNPNLFGTIVDSTYGALGATMAAVKDSMESLSPLPIQNDISAMVSDITTGWLKAIQTTDTNIFSNTDTLGTFIENGQYFMSSNDIAPVDASIALQKGLTASILPALWLTGSQPLYSVILTTEGLDTSSTCEGWDPTSKFGHGIMGIKDLGSGLVCDGTNAYCKLITSFDDAGPELTDIRLVSAHTKEMQVASRGPVVTTYPRYVDPLPGLSDLSKYGLTKEEVAFNAINSWKHNGNKNGWAVPDATDKDFLSTISTDDIGKSYGLVKIPVCSWQQVADNLLADKHNDQNNPNYPCPP